MYYLYVCVFAGYRQQLNTSRGLSMMNTMLDLIRCEGPRNIYRGILNPIFAEAPKRATKFAATEQFKNLLRKVLCMNQ